MCFGGGIVLLSVDILLPDPDHEWDSKAPRVVADIVKDSSSFDMSVFNNTASRQFLLS